MVINANGSWYSARLSAPLVTNSPCTAGDHQINSILIFYSAAFKGINDETLFAFCETPLNTISNMRSLKSSRQ